MSSLDKPPAVRLGGLMAAPPASPLAHANKLFVSYCTSDAFMGHRAPSGVASALHFRGRSVVEATFAEMVRVHGLGRGDDPPVIVFGGSSAGTYLAS